MDHEPPPKNLEQFRPNPAELVRVVHELAMSTGNVLWRTDQYVTHAEERSGERDITDLMMFEVLRTGSLRGQIVPGRSPGEWKLKLVKEMKGRREVGVVTVVINRRRLLVKTVEWEDMR